MGEPQFKVGQRVYNRANPYHGKVVSMKWYGGTWNYVLRLDLPNPSDCPEGTFGEDGLRATLEEAVAWQKEVNETCGYICSCGRVNEAPRPAACPSCGITYEEWRGTAFGPRDGEK